MSKNIDLMEFAGFCRNCLSNWYQEAAGERGLALNKEQAREIVYGMHYEEWKDLSHPAGILAVLPCIPMRGRDVVIR